VRQVFDRLPTAEQWAVIERVFDDDELAAALSTHRDALVAAGHRREVAASVAEGDRLDTVRVPTGARLVLGLFREPDVAEGIRRGPAATTCARRLVLRSTEAPGVFQVVEDVFNPLGGFYVTGAYDQSTWERDRLPGHARVRPGAIVPGGGAEQLDPALLRGGRVDVEVDGDLRRGLLHLGYALLDEVDVFADAP
jgi:hypothetical protein